MRSRPRSSQSSTRSGWTKTDIEEDPLTVGREAPGDEDALLGASGSDRQVDRVEHEDQQADLAEAAGPEGPIAIAQLAADRAHGRLADRAQAGLPGEALDVAVTEAPDVGADDERLERSGPDDRPRVGDDRADEARKRVAHLGHGDRDLALGGLDPAGSVAIARAAGIGRPLIPGPAKEDRDFLFHGPLEDELGAEAPELTQVIGTADPIEQDRLDGFLDLDAGGYSSIHGVVSLANFLGPLWSLRRLHFYSGVRTPPASSHDRLLRGEG